jgi:hypothetical protein
LMRGWRHVAEACFAWYAREEQELEKNVDEDLGGEKVHQVERNEPKLELADGGSRSTHKPTILP